MTNQANAISREELEAAFRNNLNYQTLANADAIGWNDKFPFACRGCGQLCCVDKTILVLPTEAIRIAWKLEWLWENKLLLHPPAPFGMVFPGGGTGLPVMSLNFIPLSENGPSVCPFVAPVYEGDNVVATMCVIHDDRPGCCRVWPLGRYSMNGWFVPEKDEYRIMERCPGFTRSPSTEIVPPDYPATMPDQTVGDWITKSLDPDVEEEKRFYITEVIPAWMKKDLHAPYTDPYANQTVKGKINRDALFGMMAGMFYTPPRRPQNGASIHEAIMKWLQQLKELADHFGPFIDVVEPFMGDIERGAHPVEYLLTIFRDGLLEAAKQDVQNAAGQ